MCHDTSSSFDQKICGTDFLTFFRKDVSLLDCQFFEGSCDVDSVILLKEYRICLFEIRGFNEFIWI